MNRRGFLMGAGGILALGVAPAIVRADSLMRIVKPCELQGGIFIPMQSAVDAGLTDGEISGIAELSKRVLYFKHSSIALIDEHNLIELLYARSEGMERSDPPVVFPLKNVSAQMGAP